MFSRIRLVKLNVIRIAGRHGRTVPERFLLSQSHPPFRDVGMERQGQTVAPKYPGRHLVWNMQHNFSQVRHALSNTDKHSRLAFFASHVTSLYQDLERGIGISTDAREHFSISVS